MSEEKKIYDLSMLNEMEKEEPGSLAQIINIFLESTPEILETINYHFRHQDYMSLGNSAHKLKSSIDLLQMEELSPLIRKIEFNAKNQENLDELPSQIETLNRIMNQAFEMLKIEIS